jgi:hypothetical protein
MGMRNRISRLEEKAWGGADPPCPECGGQVIKEEIAANGGVSYLPDPCEACGSWGNGGRVGRIIVDNRAPENRPEREDTFTFKLDKPGHEEESEVTVWP